MNHIELFETKKRTEWTRVQCILILVRIAEIL